MKNPTLKGFEGTPEDFTKILFEGWWNHRRKLVRKLESEMECNIFETLHPIGIREKLLESPLDITHHTRRKDLLFAEFNLSRAGKLDYDESVGI